MFGPVEKLREYGIPVNSAVSAIQYVNGREDLTKEQYEANLSDLTGTSVSYDNKRIAKYTYLYFIQNAIKLSQNTDRGDAVALLEKSNADAVHYIKNNKWVFAAEDNPDNAPAKVDSNGKPKRKKGAKQEEAARIYQENKGKDKKDIIQKFMDELDMSKAGATTYFYNMKKKFGA